MRVVSVQWVAIWVEGHTWLTLPTSTSLVIITMLKQFSCHTILQKSYRVSCLGPRGKHTERRKEKSVRLWPFALNKGVCAVFKSHIIMASLSPCLLPKTTPNWSLEIAPPINLLGIPGIKDEGDGWQNISGSWWWKPAGTSVTLRHLSWGCLGGQVQL